MKPSARPRVSRTFAPLSRKLAKALKKVAEEFKAQEGRYPTTIVFGLDAFPFEIPPGHKLVYCAANYRIKIEWVPGRNTQIS